jgi:hypothetical protein
MAAPKFLGDKVLIDMDRLAYIITDMLKSALAWEEEHGVPELKANKTLLNKTLTNSRHISKIPTKTENHEDKDDSKK